MIGIRPISGDSSLYIGRARKQVIVMERSDKKEEESRDLRSGDLSESEPLSIQKLFMYLSISQSCTQVL